MPELETYRLYIGGNWVDAESKATYETLNPFTQEPWATVPDADARPTSTPRWPRPRSAHAGRGAR